MTSRVNETKSNDKPRKNEKKIWKPNEIIRGAFSPSRPDLKFSFGGEKSKASLPKSAKSLKVVVH